MLTNTRPSRFLARSIKNWEWPGDEANFEAERGRQGEKLVWKCICYIQRGRSCLMLMRSAVVKDENGDVCTTTDTQNDRWRRHFSEILNMQSEFDMEELERVKQRRLRPEIAELSTEEELLKAID